MKYAEVKLPLNGDSDEWRRWIDEERPINGELCTVKIVMDIEVYYTPENKKTPWIFKDKRKKEKGFNADPIAWRPIPNSKNFYNQ